MDFSPPPSVTVKRRLICPCIWAILTTCLFVVSLFIDYQRELIKEHVRFRKGFPSRTLWENPPGGTLRLYLFNVINAEAFTNGTDKKLRVEEVGPIVYRMHMVNSETRTNEDESTLTYRKVRYHTIKFDEEKSAPGVLKQKVIMPNPVLLSLAARMHDWFFLARNAFNMYAKTEPIFLEHTVEEYLWNYTTPLIDKLAKYLPGVPKNAGMLVKALRNKREIYTMNIGTKHGLENVFKVRSLNNLTVIPEHFSKSRINPETCPIHVSNSYENSLYSPYLKRNDQLSIVTADSCRVVPLHYDSDFEYSGYSGYKFVMSKDNRANCLNSSMGIPLPEGMYDISSCVYDVPSAISQPHFFGSSYDFNAHFEGLSPNADRHQTYILVEPKVGVTVEEKYRFQSNIPVPHLRGFSERIRRFNGMFVPTLWCEFDLDDFTFFNAMILKFTAYYAPYVQKLCMVLMVLAAMWNTTKFLCRLYRRELHEMVWCKAHEMQQAISIDLYAAKCYNEANSFLPRTPTKEFNI